MNITRNAIADDNEELLTARTVCLRLSIPRAWLRNQATCKVHRIPYFLIGHQLRFRQSDLRRWCDAVVVVRPPCEDCSDGE
jgi:hypothetical protein